MTPRNNNNTRPINQADRLPPTANERAVAAQWLRNRGYEASRLARLNNATTRDEFTSAICELHDITLDVVRRARLGDSS